MWIFNFTELDAAIANVPDIDVEITGAVNLHSRPLSNYEVRLAYGELTLIVAMLRDYVKGFDQLKEEGKLPINEVEYDCYYRKKFMDVANRISEQIEYDYDKQVEKCNKKAAKIDNSDIGEEAMALALKRG